MGTLSHIFPDRQRPVARHFECDAPLDVGYTDAGQMLFSEKRIVISETSPNLWIVTVQGLETNTVNSWLLDGFVGGPDARPTADVIESLDAVFANAGTQLRCSYEDNIRDFLETAVSAPADIVPLRNIDPEPSLK